MYANVPAADPPEQEFDRKPVELGINDGEKYELLAGLNEGDTVVISGEAESRWASGRQRRSGPVGRRLSPARCA